MLVIFLHRRGIVMANGTDAINIMQTIYYLAATIAALGAFLTYWNNSQRERAKWAAQLYEKFYETYYYKPIRKVLDCTPNSTEVIELVAEESDEFTDYLNFFEMVCFLAAKRQVLKKDVSTLFGYYLCCLKKHEAVMRYLNNKDNSFEQLSGFLKDNIL